MQLHPHSSNFTGTVFWALMFILTLLCGYSLGVQRMGLLQGGNTELRPGGIGNLPVVCLDESDEPPTMDTPFTNVHNALGPESVVVEIGNESIPLQKAIDQKLVRITGVSPSSADEAYIDEVRVVNLTDKTIRVRVKEGAVLGVEGRKPFDYDVTKLLTPNADQDAVWRGQPELASQHAKWQMDALKSLGYSADPGNGNQNQAAQSLRAFQRSHGLESTTDPESKTDAALKDATDNAKRLAAINGRGKEMLIVTLSGYSNRDQEALYVLQTGDHETGFNRTTDMISAFGKLLDENKNAKSIYIDMKYVSQKDEDALTTSLRAASAKERLLRVLTRDKDGISTRSQDTLFERGIELVPGTEKLEPVGSDSWKSELKFKSGERKGILRIFAKTKELLAKFISALKLQFTKEGRFSIEEGVRRAREELKKEVEGLKDEDIRIEMENEFGETQVVTIQGSVGVAV